MSVSLIFPDIRKHTAWILKEYAVILFFEEKKKEGFCTLVTSTLKYFPLKKENKNLGTIHVSTSDCSPEQSSCQKLENVI